MYLRYVKLACGHVRITLLPAYEGRVLPCFECMLDQHVKKVMTTKEAEGNG